MSLLPQMFAINFLLRSLDLNQILGHIDHKDYGFLGIMPSISIISVIDSTPPCPVTHFPFFWLLTLLILVLTPYAGFSYWGVLVSQQPVM